MDVHPDQCEEINLQRNCVYCGANTIIFTHRQTRSGDEAPTLISSCTTCNHTRRFYYL